MFHRPVPTYCFLEGVFQEEPLACLALLKSELYNAKEINGFFFLLLNFNDLWPSTSSSTIQSKDSKS